MTTPRHAASKLAFASCIILPITLRAAAAATAPEGAVDELQEVVVTAQFRKENLQQTPIAITAVSADTIDERGFTRLDDITRIAPNVSLRPGGNMIGNAVQAFIRGIGQLDSDIGREPGVGIYIDDVYFGTLFGSALDLVDLDRVEVLRGPQGTLSGKNAIGGAIRLVTARPTGSGKGSVQVTGGELDRLDVKGNFDVALVPDTVFLRASGFSHRRDGYVTLVDFACAYPQLINTSATYHLSAQGGDDPSCRDGALGGEDVQGARAALRLFASPQLEFNLTGDYSNDRSGAVASELVAVNSAYFGVGGGGFGLNQALTQQQGLGMTQLFVAPRYHSYVNFNQILRFDPNGNVGGVTSVPQANGVRQWGLAGTAEFNFTDKDQLKSITAYRAYSGDSTAVVSNTPISIGGLNQVFLHDQFSQELRLTGTTLGGRFDWALGGFYFRSSTTLQGSSLINASGPPPAGVLSIYTPQVDDTSTVKDVAFFTQETYRFSDRFSVTAGTRYTRETKGYVYNQVFRVAPPNDVYKVWTPRFSFDYQVTPDAMAYAAYSKGFRAGGFNSRPIIAADVQPFKPEYLDSYEIGAKTEWFKRHLVLNGAAFFGKYKDLQMSGQAPRNDGSGLPFPYLGSRNVGKADIRGLELELTLRGFGGLLVNGSFGMADYKYKSIAANFLGCADPAAVPGLCMLNGPTYKSIPQGTPKTTANLGAEYRFEVGGAGSLTPRLDASYSSRVYWTLNNDPRSVTPGIPLLEARLTYADPSEKWTVAFGVTNLTNRFYYLNYNDLYDSAGLIEGQPALPRQWSLTLRRDFK